MKNTLNICLCKGSHGRSEACQAINTTRQDVIENGHLLKMPIEVNKTMYTKTNEHVYINVTYKHPKTHTRNL